MTPTLLLLLLVDASSSSTTSDREGDNVPSDDGVPSIPSIIYVRTTTTTTTTTMNTTTMNTEKKKREGRKRGSKNWTRVECLHFLNIAKQIRPKSGAHWEEIAARHQKTYPDRIIASILSKYNNLI